LTFIVSKGCWPTVANGCYSQGVGLRFTVTLTLMLDISPPGYKPKKSNPELWTNLT